MRLTRRDVRLIRDLALSHVLSRDQILRLGYFGSVTRLNTRLRELITQLLVRRLDTPFSAQRLYVPGKLAPEVAGDCVGRLIEARASSPRFIVHALNVTNVRLALRAKTSGEWRFEQQLWRQLGGPKPCEIRPDGLFMGKQPIFIEVDMGHVAAEKFGKKLAAYQALACSDQCSDHYGFSEFRVLVVTTGSLRARHLRQQLPPNARFELLVQTYREVGAALIESWS